MGHPRQTIQDNLSWCMKNDAYFAECTTSPSALQTVKYEAIRSACSVYFTVSLFEYAAEYRCKFPVSDARVIQANI
jgi:hypothetical protein